VRFAWFLLLATIIVIVARPELTRPGYTADEEFTEFAVRGILTSGLPLLPSGLLYDRGLAYSYAAAATRAVFGDGLAPARALSLASALLALVALWVAVRRATGGLAAWLALLLVATSVPFWVVATTARFYAPYLALYVSVLATLASLHRASRLSPRHALLLIVTAAFCRWTHELAFTLAAVPLCCAVVAGKGTRTKWIYATLAVGIGLIVAQAGIFALHFIAPQSGGTMIRRFFLWQVLNLFKQPPFDPFAFFEHIARTMPALTMALLALIVARMLRRGGAWTGLERAAHLLWLGWILFFGVIDSGITINYLLIPVTLMLGAVGIDLAAVVEWQQPRPRVGGVALGAALVIVAGIDVGTWGVDPRGHLAEARPTIVAPDPARLREMMAAAPLVACTDELACLLLGGRVDRWLALDDFLRTRFVVTKAAGDVGVYAGTPAIYRLKDLLTPNANGQPPPHVLIVDVFKELPVGNSAAFLPRAMAAEGLTGAARLETTQLRLVDLDGATSRTSASASEHASYSARR
jgi:hypothetical protein